MKFTICLIFCAAALTACSPAPKDGADQSIGARISRFFQSGSTEQNEAHQNMQREQKERLDALHAERKKFQDERQRLYDNQKYFQYKD